MESSRSCQIFLDERGKNLGRSLGGLFLEAICRRASVKFCWSFLQLGFQWFSEGHHKKALKVLEDAAQETFAEATGH